MVGILESVRVTPRATTVKGVNWLSLLLKIGVAQQIWTHKNDLQLKCVEVFHVRTFGNTTFWTYNFFNS